MTTSAAPPRPPAAAPGNPRQPRRPAGPLVFAGLLAVAAAVAVGQLLGVVLEPGAAPFLAVADAVVRLTPAWLKDFAVATFGTGDKLALEVVMAVVMAGFAALAGLLSRRHPGPGLTLITVFGLLATYVVGSAPNLGQLAVLAPLASLVTGFGTFRLLHHHLPTEPAPTRPEPTVLQTLQRDTQPRVDRRSFNRAWLGVLGGTVLAGGGGLLIEATDSSTADRASIGPLIPARAAPPIPADAAFTSDGTPPFITPNAEFYRIDTALSVPRIALADWRLRVHGMVDRPVTFDFADIRNRALVERAVTLTCVSNPVGGPYVSTSRFIGVPLRDLLAEAGVHPGADQVLSTSADGFTVGTPTAAIMDPNRGAMLAIGMNREPLPPEHGFPARMVVPGLYGYVSATKWVTDIELTTFAAQQAYWVPRGYAQQAPIKTQSRIDRPGADQSVSAGRVTVAGIAWAQPHGIAAVQVRIGDGPWQDATLAADVGGDTWRMWRTVFTLGPGDYTVQCRATDRTGRTQTADQASDAPDGATGWPAVDFRVS